MRKRRRTSIGMPHWRSTPAPSLPRSLGLLLPCARLRGGAARGRVAGGRVECVFLGGDAACWRGATPLLPLPTAIRLLSCFPPAEGVEALPPLLGGRDQPHRPPLRVPQPPSPATR